MTAAYPERKFLCSELLVVEWSPDWGQTRTMVANLESIWHSGATLLSDLPVVEGTCLRLNAAGREFRAVVKFCSMDELGYLMELEFGRGSEWTPEAYMPEHLFDPNTLLGFPTLVS